MTSRYFPDRYKHHHVGTFIPDSAIDSDTGSDADSDTGSEAVSEVFG